jgi:aspartyl/glutamyl-tRNA(Asn/Gln) amidotransferase C subunit
MSQKRKTISVDHLEKLANLSLEPKEKAKVGPQLEKTLQHFDILDQTPNLDQEKPTFQVTKNTNIVAEDKTKACLPREKVLPDKKKFFTTDND